MQVSILTFFCKEEHIEIISMTDLEPTRLRTGETTLRLVLLIRIQILKNQDLGFMLNFGFRGKAPPSSNAISLFLRMAIWSTILTLELHMYQKYAKNCFAQLIFYTIIEVCVYEMQYKFVPSFCWKVMPPILMIQNGYHGKINEENFKERVNLRMIFFFMCFQL